MSPDAPAPAPDRASPAPGDAPPPPRSARRRKIERDEQDVVVHEGGVEEGVTFVSSRKRALEGSFSARPVGARG